MVEAGGMSCSAEEIPCDRGTPCLDAEDKFWDDYDVRDNACRGMEPRSEPYIRCHSEAFEAAKHHCCNNDDCATLLDCYLDEQEKKEGEAGGPYPTGCGSGSGVVIVIILLVLCGASVTVAVILRKRRDGTAVQTLKPLAVAVPAVTASSPAASAAAPVSVRAQLMGLNVGALRQRAIADGCEESQIEEARDSDDPKAELIDLIEQQASKAPPQVDLVALRTELSVLSVKELRARATTAGVDADALEEARDMDDPKSAIVELVVASTAAPNPDPRILRTQLQDKLKKISTKQLREIAAREGVAADAIEDARDADNPQSALCELIVALDHPADILSKLSAAAP